MWWNSIQIAFLQQQREIPLFSSVEITLVVDNPSVICYDGIIQPPNFHIRGWFGFLDYDGTYAHAMSACRDFASVSRGKFGVITAGAAKRSFSVKNSPREVGKNFFPHGTRNFDIKESRHPEKNFLSSAIPVALPSVAFSRAGMQPRHIADSQTT